MNHLRRSVRNLTITLASVVACIVGLYLSDDYGDEADDGLFRIPSDAVVDDIRIQSAGDSVRLLGNASGWSIGDSVRAGQDRVRVLLAALQRMKPGRAPGTQMRDSLKSAFLKSGVQVTVSAGNEQVLLFSALGNEERQETWLSDSDGSEIRRMSIPGYSTYLMEIFSADPDTWRDTRLFNLNWRNFSGYTARFPGRSGDDFTVAQQDGMFTVSGVATDTARLNSYLDAVSLMSAESIRIPDAEELNQILSTPVGVILQVREVSGNFFQVSVLASGDVLVQPKPGRYFMAQVNPAQRRILLLPRPHFRRQN